MTTNHPAPHTATRLARLTRRSALLWVLTISAFAISCAEEKGKHAPAIDEKDSVPFMQSWGISTLISDSGVIRYKITAEEWNIYNTTNPPRWTFVKGILLEKFDSTFHIDWFVQADTAYCPYGDKPVGIIRDRWLCRTAASAEIVCCMMPHTSKMRREEQKCSEKQERAGLKRMFTERIKWMQSLC